MWKGFATALLPALMIGCAGTPERSPEAQWSAYRAQMHAERDRGQLHGVDMIYAEHAKYPALFGIDPTMEGLFAFGHALYAAADAGEVSPPTADALLRAREAEITQRRQAQRPLGGAVTEKFGPLDVWQY